MERTLLATHGQTIHTWASDKHHLGTQGKRLGNVRTRTDTRVKQDVQLVADGIDNLWEHFNRRDRVVHLATTMRRDDNTIHAVLDSKLGIFHVHDTLEHNGSIPVLAQVLEVIPRVTSTTEHLGGPFRGGRREVLHHGLAVLLLELLLEDWVAQTETTSGHFWEQEGVEAVVQVCWAVTQSVCVKRHHKRGEACLLCSAQDASCDVVALIWWPVELEETVAVAVRLGHIFQACRACRAHDVRDAGLLRGCGHAALTLAMEDGVHTNWRDRDRGRHVLSEDLVLRHNVALGHWDKATRHKVPLLKVLALLVVRVTVTSGTLDVTIRVGRQDLTGLFFPLAETEAKSGELVVATVFECFGNQLSWLHVV